MNTRHPEAALLLPMSANRQAQRAEAVRLDAAQPASDHGPGGWLRVLVARIGEAMSRRRAIAELRALSDRELADIGVSRAEIPALFRTAPVAAPAARPAAPLAANDRVGTRVAA